MSQFRDNLIDVYRWLTASARDAVTNSFDQSHQWPAGVLFYHRVADTTPNAWSITNDNFVKHLDLISELATFASLDQLIDSQNQSSRNELAVAITFDDGYAENLDLAIPELIRRKIPCTYFVTTDHVENQLSFAHDLQRNEPLCVNSISEIRWMANNGIQIGGHSASHLDLGQPCSHSRLVTEISDSRKKLQDWTGQEIAYFAFPYGLVKNISQAAIDVVFESGYRAFLSAFGGWNFPGGDAVHLSRIHAACGTASLLNWLTMDPRKTHRKSPLKFAKPESLPAHDDSRVIPASVFCGLPESSTMPSISP